MSADPSEATVDSFILYVTQFLDEGKFPNDLKDKRWLPKIACFKKLCLAAHNENEKGNFTAYKATELVVETLHKSNMENVKEFLRFFDLPMPMDLMGPSKARFLSFVKKPFQFVVTTHPVRVDDIGDGDGFKALFVVSKEDNEMADQMNFFEEHFGKEFLDKPIREKLITVQNELRGKSLTLKGTKDQPVWLKLQMIRLRGIDAPEMEQTYGDKARYRLQKFIGGRSVTVFVSYIDPFGRYVADVFSRGMNVQEYLLRTGAAWQHIYFDRTIWFKMLQENAVKNRIGLWEFDNPEQPWVFKRRKRERELKERERERGIKRKRGSYHLRN